MITRRGFLSGLAAGICAPAIVKYASIMPVKVMPEGLTAERVHDIVRHMRTLIQPDYFLIVRPSLYDDIVKRGRMAEFGQSFNARIIRQEPIPRFEGLVGSYQGVQVIG